MSDLTEYFGLLNRISDLEAELLAQAKQHAKEVRTLKRAAQRSKLECQRALLKDKRPEWALVLIKAKAKGKDITFTAIAKECRMSYKRVVEIANEVRKGLR